MFKCTVDRSIAAVGARPFGSNEMEWRDDNGGYVIVNHWGDDEFSILVFGSYGEHSSTIYLRGAKTARELSGYFAYLASEIDHTQQEQS
jgi:hypothetical protein